MPPFLSGKVSLSLFFVLGKDSSELRGSGQMERAMHALLKKMKRFFCTSCSKVLFERVIIVECFVGGFGQFEMCREVLMNDPESCEY